MRDYLLFLDTEATGLPRKWNLPYSDSSNWPSAVQISWLVFKNDGSLVKSENHFIKNRDVELSPSAVKVHGITRDYLDTHGEERASVLELFSEDLMQYQPMVIGHFMEFDFHVTSADFFRCGLSNPLDSLPQCCTMLASSVYTRDPSVSYLRLSELYTTLFNTKLENPHDALVDAKATAECFFELLKRGDINDEKIELQQIRAKNQTTDQTFPWITSVFITLFLVLLITLWKETNVLSF